MGEIKEKKNEWSSAYFENRLIPSQGNKYVWVEVDSK